MELNGEVVQPQKLRLPKAQEVAQLLMAEPPIPFVKFIECRCEGEGLYREVVIFDVDVEVSQKPVNDIRRVERIAAVFTEADALHPDALALRSDFPLVPHLNIRLYEYPKSLCLSDQPYHETKIRWTARWFVESIRNWLARTAEGRLHQQDQPLEPLLSGFPTKIILPSDLFVGSQDHEHLYVHAVGQDEKDYVLRTSRIPQILNGQKTFQFIAVPIESAPHTHGVIRWQPRTLKDLHEFLLPVGTDLLGELRTRLRSWEGNADILNARLILILSLPKKREETGSVENRETWGFLTVATIKEVGAAIDAWGLHEGHRGMLLRVDADKRGEEIRFDLLLPYFTLSRTTSAALNGLAGPCDKRITAIGSGSLGSHVFNNLFRAGYGEWVLIDDDPLLPHNLARHELTSEALGFPKAHALALDANNLIDAPARCSSLVANVLEPGAAAAAVRKSVEEAEVLLDLSASIAVARHLGRDLETGARRISTFLNPSGSTLVVLAEDQARSIKLDSLEMQYYRSLTVESRLANHFATRDGRIRYGHSCRDVSSQISQELVALHAAIASRAVRKAMDGTGASITLWRADEDLSVERIQISPAPVQEARFDTWTICTDEQFLEKVRALREAKVPRETGGVLIGSFDMERKVVYVVDTLASPPDSEEQPTVYIRGSQGLREEVECVSKASGTWLEYVGEWHSHPPGVPPSCSADDRKLFQWLRETMGVDGHPPLMLIVADREHRWFVDRLPED